MASVFTEMMSTRVKFARCDIPARPSGDRPVVATTVMSACARAVKASGVGDGLGAAGRASLFERRPRSERDDREKPQAAIGTALAFITDTLASLSRRALSKRDNRSSSSR